jgi:serine/threonine-protein kinase
VAAPEAPAAQAAKATLTFAITPWGEIYIDGRKAGISPPLTELALAPGAHSVEIRNSAFAPHHVRVNLDASETLKIKHIFK